MRYWPCSSEMSWSIGHQSVDEWREATVADFLKRPSTVPTKGLTLSSSLHALPRHAIRPATSQQRGSDKAATRQLPQLLPETVPFPQELPSATTAEGISLHRVPRHARKATRRDQLRRVESLPMTKRDQPPKLESLSLTKGNEPRILKPLSPVLSDARRHHAGRAHVAGQPLRARPEHRPDAARPVTRCCWA